MAKVMYSAPLDEELLQRFRAVARALNYKIQDALSEAMEEWLQKHSDEAAKFIAGLDGNRE